MLDGLLGKGGFHSKCKSLIKLTRTRIDVIRRKRGATQKFLRKDIADLLADGLEINAFGRAEGLVTELISSSCYDFIDYVCEVILRHLPVMQKLRECPEDSREAVASLMFAAARFSDLPELRELRDIFQERYSSGLECYVNRKLVENMNPKPPSMEKKLQLMQEIATEFSIRWDSKGFERRMSDSSSAKQDQPKGQRTLHAASNKYLTPNAEANQKTIIKDEVLEKKINCVSNGNNERAPTLGNGHQPKTGSEKNHKSLTGKDHHGGTLSPPMGREEITNKRDNLEIPVRRTREPRPDDQGSLNQERTDPVNNTSRYEKRQEFDNNKYKFDNGGEVRKTRDEETDVLKSGFRSAIPPPYVKPRKSKHRTELSTNHLNINGQAGDNDGSINEDTGSDKVRAIAPEGVDGQVRYTEIYYRDDNTPRPRSHRRRHHRSHSTRDGISNGEEQRVVRRVSSSRRRGESRKGLQILFDDDHYHKKDEEEKIIDKLLIHYSQKPTPSEPGKLSRKHKATDKGEATETPPPRSMSLPRDQVASSDPQKVFTRAASFQQELLTPAKHVHPKLPDYDDLAARFAALRASKG